MKKILWALCAISTLFNIGLVVLFREKAAVTGYSVPAIILMAAIVYNGFAAIALRHKGNFLVLRHHGFFRPFGADREYTYSEEYEKKFSWMLPVYFSAVPFYLPCIFFVKTQAGFLWALLVLCVPQLVFWIHSIMNERKDAKEKQQKRETELREQQLREESGRFK